jgi:GTP diphosphokinase / guanosine-3',5'-bis(diphosphate) 3'-diphosphatase
VQVGQVVTKLIGRLKTVEVVSPEEQLMPARRPQKRPAASSSFGIVVDEAGDPDVLVRMAKCCTPVPGDEICGYISLGRGITIHRDDCPNVRALRRTPERFTPVHWDDAETATSSFRVTIALQSWDRPRLLEDVARTFAEHGANIVEYGGHVADQMARNWYTVEVGDVKELRSLLTALRNIDAVFDAYRVTPTG